LGRAQRAPLAQLACVRRLPLSTVTDTPGPRVRHAPFLKPTPSSLSLFTTDRIRRPYPFLPCLEHLRVIKMGCRTPSAPSFTEAEDRHHLEEATRESQS
jgi:hypothetical protein